MANRELYQIYLMGFIDGRKESSASDDHITETGTLISDAFVLYCMGFCDGRRKDGHIQSLKDAIRKARGNSTLEGRQANEQYREYLLAVLGRPGSGFDLVAEAIGCQGGEFVSYADLVQKIGQLTAQL